MKSTGWTKKCNLAICFLSKSSILLFICVWGVGWGLNTAIPLLLGVSFLIWKMALIAHLGQLLPLNVILGASVDNVNMTWYTWKKFTALTSKSNIAQHSAIPGWLCWATQENALDCKCKDSSSSPLNGQEISTPAHPFLRQYLFWIGIVCDLSLPFWFRNTCEKVTKIRKKLLYVAFFGPPCMMPYLEVLESVSKMDWRFTVIVPQEIPGNRQCCEKTNSHLRFSKMT